MRTPALTIFLLLLLAAAPVQAGTAVLNTSLNILGPLTVDETDTITLLVQVSNGPDGNALGVVPSVVPAYGSSGNVSLQSGPIPAQANIDASSIQSFTYVFMASSCGSVQFSADATGSDEASSNQVASNTASSAIVTINCATPSPTITVTATPQVIEVTPTPGPQESSAGVRANVFRASTGQPVLLDFAVAHYTDITVRIYNRNGRAIKTIQTVVGPGRYTESWDGRNDQGQPVASGIYIVHFRGKGLDVRAKVAVVR